MARSSPFLFLLLLLLLLLSILIATSAHSGSHSDSDSDSDADADSNPPPNLRSKSLVLVKIWCLIIVFAGTFLGGVSPYFLKWNEGFLVLGTQFAGGVFLGTAMIHFLSDSDATFRDLTEREYPFAFMLACAGYVATMLADCVISGSIARGRGVRDVEGGGGGRDGDRGSVSQDKNDGGLDSHATVRVGVPDQSAKSLIQNATSLGDSVLLIVALCFHSIFEGIAIGVAENRADAWRALWTVSLHKVFAAIAMGIALLRMIPDRPLASCVGYAFAFAISSPIGVAIGIVIDATTEGHVADWIYAISMGLACGIFIYVSINHLLSKGYQPQKPTAADSTMNKWLAVVLGVGVIAVVMIWDT